MQTATNLGPDYRKAAAALPRPSRYWFLGIVATSGASWVVIIGAAKLLLGYI